MENLKSKEESYEQWLTKKANNITENERKYLNDMYGEEKFIPNEKKISINHDDVNAKNKILAEYYRKMGLDHLIE